MTEPYSIKFKGSHWRVCFSGRLIDQFVRQRDAEIYAAGLNEGYAKGVADTLRMTDEQIRAVKELRDACAVLLEMAKSYKDVASAIAPLFGLYGNGLIYSFDAPIDNATEAIKKVEGMIV